VWKVHFFSNDDRDFIIDIPCWPRHGVTQLGFGTINDLGSSLEVLQSGDAPATLLSDENWESADEKAVTITKINQLTATNSSERRPTIVVGTINNTAERYSNERVRPFLLIEDLTAGEVFALESRDLYLHAFKVRANIRDYDYGYKVGRSQGRSGHLESHVIEEERITPKDGIRVNDIKPVSSYICLVIIGH